MELQINHILICLIHLSSIFLKPISAYYPFSALSFGEPDFPENTFQCKRAGDKYVHPDDCGTYYECVKDLGRWRYAPKSCEPAGTTFDNELKMCVDLYGWCPNEPSTYPPIQLCEYPNDLHVDPEDCSRYFRCHLYHNGNYYPEPMQCSGNKHFDDLYGQKQCVDGTCPQELLPLPDDIGWHCTSINEFNVLPTDCSRFYECIKCSANPDGFCFTVKRCPDGLTYDDTLKSCVEGPCPQELKELPGGPGWHCQDQGDINVNPESCADAYECVRCSKPLEWCYGDMPCPDGYYFDDIAKRCVETTICPQDLTPLPYGWKCYENGDTYVHPNHCNEFYTCLPCSKPGGWCIILEECPTGENFDEMINMCVSRVCPQTLTPLMPDSSIVCMEAGQKIVDLDHCATYYECHPCNYPGGWCVLTHVCPEGQNFDQETSVCVASPCPQSFEELPDDSQYHCQYNGQMNVNPYDCSQWYICNQCSKPRGWCMVRNQCPMDQFFDDEKDSCVDFGYCPQSVTEELPNGGRYFCQSEGQTNADPEDCTKSYSCYKCTRPRGWCIMRAECPFGQYFSDTTGTCGYYEDCPQNPMPSLGLSSRSFYREPSLFQYRDSFNSDLLCETNGEYPMPGNCYHYYKCKCHQDVCLRIEVGCRTGYYFNRSYRECLLLRPGSLCPYDDYDY